MNTDSNDDFREWTSIFEERIKNAKRVTQSNILSNLMTGEVDPATYNPSLLDLTRSGKLIVNYSSLASFARDRRFFKKKHIDGSGWKIYRFDMKKGYYEQWSMASFAAMLIETINDIGGSGSIPVTFVKMVENNIVPALNDIDDIVPSREFEAIRMFYDDGEIMPFRNCIYSMRYNMVLPRTSFIFIEHPIDADFDPEDMNNEVAKRYLEIMSGDEELMEDMFEQIGYVLYARKFINPVFSIFTGSSGSNGKSTVTNTIEKLLGRKSISNLSVYDMSNTFTLANAEGRYLNLSTDSSSGSKDRKYATADALEFIKKSTSGEAYTFNPKHQAPFEGYGPRKFIFATNVDLNFGGFDGGFERRMRVIPFKQRFKDDSRVVAQFKDRHAVNWFAMHSLVAFMCFIHREFVGSELSEFTPNMPITGVWMNSKASEEAKTEQVTSQSTVLEWLSEEMECNIADKDCVRRSLNGKYSLYLQYTEYCHMAGRNTVTLQRFNKDLFSKFGIDKRRTCDSFGNHTYIYYDPENMATIIQNSA